MKIDKAIHSVNSNKTYFDFWEPVSKVWKEKFNIEPELYYFYESDEEKDVFISEKYGKVKKIKYIDNIPHSMQVLWSRYFFPSLEPENISIICDIDMFPISKNYFIDSIKHFSNDKYLHLYPCIERNGGNLPSCYHVASGKNFKKYLELPDSWEESINLVIDSNLGYNLNGMLWGADEAYATKKILKNKDENVFFLEREEGRRIDRSNWNYDKEKVLLDHYYDSHSIRPYQAHKNEIDTLVKLILGFKNE